MELLDQLMVKFSRVTALLANKRVGVFPSDYGRFDQSMAPLLEGVNVTGILLPAPHTNNQGLTPYYDRDLFLASIDVCLCWGTQKEDYELQVYARTKGYSTRFINLFDPQEPLSIIRPEQTSADTPAYFHIPADPLDDDGLAVLTGISAKFVRPYAEFEQNIVSNIHNWVHDTPYQTGIAKDGAVPFSCPYCGKPLHSRHSFVISGKGLGHTVFHPFSCCKEFFLVSKPYGFNYAALYIPNGEQVILLAGVHGKTVYPLEKKVFRAIEQLKILLFQYRTQVGEYLATPPTGVRGIMGTSGNVGHYIISEANAVHRFRAEHDAPQDCISIHAKVHGIMQGFFDDSMLSLATAQDEKRIMVNLFLSAVRDKKLCYFPYTWAPLAQEPRRRLLDESRNRCTVRADRMMQQAEQCAPLIMVTLRPPTRRIWTTQDEDTAWILNKLHEQYPNLGVVFDGLLMEGTYCLRDNLDAVVEKLDPNIQFFEAIDCPLEETLAWADLCKLYFGPFGAGVGLVTPANLPVVSFGPHHSFANITWQRNGRVLTTGIDMEHAPFVISPSSNERVEGGDIYYDVDREDILKSVLNLLKNQVKQ